MAALADGEDVPGLFRGTGPNRRTAFLFSGQGGQRAEMGRELAEVFPVFSAALDEICAHFDFPLREAMFAADGTALDETLYTQAGVFALEVALFRLVESWGPRPAYVLGHSLGELAAAHVAGVMSLPDACALVAARGRLMGQVAGDGAMAVIQAAEHEVAAGLSANVSLAAINGPASVVVAGDADAVAGLGARWQAKGRVVQRLNVRLAGHSPHMDAILGPLGEVLAGLELRPARIPLVSNVTGTIATETDLRSPSYWVRHVREPVRFHDGMRRLREEGVTAFLELGPDGTLTGMGRACLGEDTEAVLVPALRGSGAEARAIVLALAQLHACGTPVDWDPIFAGSGAEPAPLPAGLSDRDAATGTGLSFRERLPALPERERLRVLTDLVRTQVAFAADHLTADEVTGTRPFAELGLTSLNAVELRDRLAAATGTRPAATLMFDHPTPAALARHLHDLLAGTAGGPRTAPAPMAGDPVAVVSMSCRYPGEVRSPEDLWRLVSTGQDATGGFPADRGWDLEILSRFSEGRKGAKGPAYRNAGGFLYTAGEFDPSVFRLSPREALAMDPQQRLALECSWEAIERAGIDPVSLKSTETGVFVGTNGQDYASLLHASQEGVDVYHGTGGAASVLSGRISYALGLEGPALSVDTACSSSLVALHLAGQALRQGECSMALVVGVTVMATQRKFLEFARNRGLSPDGRCMSFAESANGIALSEGIGVLLLERLSDARRNGHRVHALLRGSAINQDGASNGLTAPNGPSQERVIRRALAHAGLRPDDVDAVEAHGTGTPLGDPIEANALLATYGRDRPAGRPLWLGSLKSNLGHSQAAAGVGGVIKVIMSLRHGLLPRTLHVDEPTSRVDWSAGPVRLLTRETAWPARDVPRRAAVSAFGISGTNAHVIIEEAPHPNPGPSPNPVLSPNPALAAEPARARDVRAPWIFAARTEPALRARAAQLLDVLERGAAPADVAVSLATSRASLEYGAAIVATGRAHLAEALTAVTTGGETDGLHRRTTRKEPATTLRLTAGGGRFADELATALPTYARELAAITAAPGTGVWGPSGQEAGRALIRCLLHWGLRPDSITCPEGFAAGIADLAGVPVLAAAAEPDSGLVVTVGDPLVVTIGDPARPAHEGHLTYHPGEGAAVHELATLLARLYAAGVTVNWRAFTAEFGGGHVDLPTYPFQRRHYWLKAPAAPYTSH
ncbi:beta-ketoacyl synthase N-terminal-like domain-containing protein [Nonomuraea sp. NPDC050394]|uniref:beta-ketoacyl synthase N-terminal-like domain-containing protein n=1 Tax=Nonomuraea sp. NPDC050394 TaxID=3364363 RepID=UPI00379A419E